MGNRVRKVHLLVRHERAEPVMACGLKGPRSHVGNQLVGAVTCIGCQRSVHMADAEVLNGLGHLNRKERT